MANIYDMIDTWNNVATTFTAIKMNVTDTTSAPDSLLMDLQVGGSSKFRVGKGAGAAFSANLFEMVNGANSQTFNLYNTYTDASNYERGVLKWNSNVLEIGAEAAGTGTGRAVKLLVGGHAANFVSVDAPTGGTASRLVLSGRGAMEFYVGSSRRVFLDDTYFVPDSGSSVDLGLPTGGFGWNSLSFKERATDPTDPAEGQSVIWQSNGAAAGDDGDIMMKITAGGVTKTATLVDFSALP